MLNGEAALFRFTTNALAELETDTGLTQDQIITLASSGEKFSVKLLRAFVRAALLHEEPELSLNDAGDILDPFLKGDEDMTALRLALANAFAEAYPKPKPMGDEKNAPAASGTGTTTSSLPQESA